MIAWLKSLFGGCAHGTTSFPQTNSETGRIEVCCLQCGKRFIYSWDLMKRGKEVTN